MVFHKSKSTTVSLSTPIIVLNVIEVSPTKLSIFKSKLPILASS